MITSFAMGNFSYWRNVIETFKMMNRINKYLTITLSVIILLSCSNESKKIQNIETFAKLYGYARWFHPSDEAQEIDWDKFAILGIQKVENIKSDTELRDTLIHLFSPIVQGLQIYTGDKQEQVDLHSITTSDSLSNRVVAWQHYGVNLGEENNIYKSFRTHRNTCDSYSFFIKSIVDVSKLRGKEIKLNGYFKIQSSNSESDALLFLYPVQGNKYIRPLTKLITKNTVNINSTEWKKYETTLKVGNDTQYILFGGALKNDISMLADNFTLSVKNGLQWEEVSSLNMDFETGKIDHSIGSCNFIENRHKFELVENDIYSGKYALKAEYTGNLFEKAPEFGEYTHESIGNNLHCIIPLALYDIDGATYPKTNDKVLRKLKKEISAVHIPYGFNMHTNLASVVISWNVFQHFYPYLDIINTNWEKVISETLEEIYTNNDKKDFTKTLSKMVAKLEDGHGVVYGERMFHLPIRTELIESNIVITASSDPRFEPGDIIERVNGVKAEKVQEEMEKLISGSPQLRKHRALNIFGSTFNSEDINVLIERDGKELSYVVRNSSANKNMFFNRINNNPYKSVGIKELEPGLFYVNLANCTYENITNQIDELAAAKSVIYDFRWGARLSLTELIPHLIDTTVNSAWWNIPQIVYPNQNKITFNTTNWFLKPKSPRFSSKSIIITAPCVVSSGETDMGIIDNYNLATTVGEPTAGCNGNINFINLPCGYKVMWTGMKVLKHDGSQHHLIGFKPDYTVERTIQGVKDGKDEVLEKAIEIARTRDAHNNCPQ